MFDFFLKPRPKNGPRPANLPGVLALPDADVELMARFFGATTTVLPMDPQEVKIAASYLCTRYYAVDETIIRAGDKIHTDFMLWILEGEASIESRSHGEGASIFMSVLGAGTALGEMGLLDGSARSANCIARVPTRCALLTKTMLQQLCNDNPAVATKLLALISIGLSGRLRDVTEKFKRYVQLNRALSEELNELSPLDSMH
jgi:CRP/FNR family transcriptional regulator, cyclic AMP receptor protein